MDDMMGHKFEDRPLASMTIGVVAFNARPIASSVSRLGARVFVSDYWGDQDLTKYCDSYVSLLNPRPGQRQRDSRLGGEVAAGLVENLLSNYPRAGLDAVILGSGLDDAPEQVKRLADVVPVIGNDEEGFARARDVRQVTMAALKHGLKIPERRYFASIGDALAAAQDISYPCVLKPRHSGGGAGVRFIRSKSELRRYLKRTDPRRLYIQQYIRGLDLSCSVLGNGSDAFALSLQGQLIGMPSSGRQCDFVYCGNYIPAHVSSELSELICESCRKLCASLSLKGSNGVDLVLDRDGNAWLMEVNPRIQGSLELIEQAASLSMSQLHYQAWLGRLPTDGPVFRPAVRMIVYADRTGTVGDLSGAMNIADVTPSGVHVKKGDPICTVVRAAGSLTLCYRSAMASAARVRRAVV